MTGETGGVPRKMRATCENCEFEYVVTNPPPGWLENDGTGEPVDDLTIICLGCSEFHLMDLEVMDATDETKNAEPTDGEQFNGSVMDAQLRTTGAIQ